MSTLEAGDVAVSPGNVAAVRARERKLSKHRTVWAGVFLFGLVLMGYAGWMEFGVEEPESEAFSLSTTDDIGTQSMADAAGAPAWSPVLAFGAVVSGIGAFGFALSGGLRSFVEFMRTDPP